MCCNASKQALEAALELGIADSGPPLFGRACATRS
jgi:hypothetical protein